MSIEALAFAKLIDLGKCETSSARLLLYVIAENTFNDSRRCRIGQAELAYQTRTGLRTVQRHISKLEEAKIIEVTRSGGDGLGRVNDDIEIRGFAEWLQAERTARGRVAASRAPQDVGEQPAKVAGSRRRRATRQNGGKGNPPLSTEQPATVGGYIKETRTSETVQVPPSPPVGGSDGVAKGSGQKGGRPMISKEARAEASRIAPGWDLEVLISRWLEWSEARDEPARNPDAAFVAFCRQQGPHKSAAARSKLIKPPPGAKLPEDAKAMPGEIVITRLSPEWPRWLDHADRVAPVTGRAMRGAFIAFVSSPLAISGAPAPRLPNPNR